MLRRRPRTIPRVALRHPAAGWLALSALYLVAVVLHLLLALRAGELWPVVVAVVLAVASGSCAAAAHRGPRR